VIKILVNEIFESIQGEGKYAGYPMLFIRLSGCTRKCDFCDTKYHTEGKKVAIRDVVARIHESKVGIVCWTGGEPGQQVEEMSEVIFRTKGKKHHLETNGDLVIDWSDFEYVCFSPKDEVACKNIKKNYNGNNMDIKVVTDLKLNRELIPYATLLMSLTVVEPNPDANNFIRQKVWDYCSKHNIRYSPRLHVEIWGTKRGI